MSIRKGSRTIASSVPVTEWGSVDGTLADQVDLKSALDSKAPTYSPTFTGTPLAPTAPIDVSNNQIATTKYVQDALLNAEANLPEQTGNAGKFLTTNGQIPSWESIDGLPSQSSQSGKFLTTNGTTASWSDLTGVVHTTGDETVGGAKTFTSTMYNSRTSTGDAVFSFINSNVTKGTVPSSNCGCFIGLYDNNTSVDATKKIGGISFRYNHAGHVSSYLIAYKPQENSTDNAYIGINYPASGDPYTAAPEPAATNSTSDTKIATTGWVNNPTLSTNVVHRSDDETIAGVKTFTSWVKYNTESANTAAYNAPAFWIKDNSLDTSALPSYTKEYYVCARDNADRYMAWTGYRYNTDGSSQVSINARTRNTANTDNVSASIYLKVFKDGTVATSAPTPSSVTDNTTKIATTEWVIDVLEALYPVGSLYIGTQNSCPLSAFFGTWTLVSAGSALWTGNGQAGSGTTTNANYANAKANTTIDAGLPNITGSFTPNTHTTQDALQTMELADSTSSGALSYTYKTNILGTSDYSQTTNQLDTLSFNASSSNAIYGKSTTVQPPAYVVNVWRRTA